MSGLVLVNDSTSTNLVEQATQQVYGLLTAFATDNEFENKVTLAFGEGFNIERLETLRQQWLVGDFTAFPVIEVRSSAELNGANGAFAAVTNTIYLSAEYLEENEENLEAIADVVLEEYGHFVDAEVNELDAAGDEGDIFSALVQGKTITENQLQLLKHEHDIDSLYLDKNIIEVEQQAGFNIELNFDYDTDEFFKKFDPSNPLPEKIADPLKINALEEAANFWEKFINNLGEEFDNIPANLLPGVSKFKLKFQNPSNPSETLKIDVGSEIDDIRIYVGSVSSFSDPKRLAQATFGGSEWKSTNSQGTSSMKQIDRRLTSVTNFEPFVGTLNFSRSANWWFDPTPEDLTDSVPQGKFDFVTNAIHEIGHVLGLSLDGNAVPAFNKKIDKQERFKGSNAKAVNNGNPIPLTGDNHVVGNNKGVIGTNNDNITQGEKSVMVPEIAPGTRLTPQPLDIAMLQDIGYGPDKKIKKGAFLESIDEVFFAIQSEIDTQIYGAKGLANNGGLNGLPLFGNTLQPETETSSITTVTQALTVTDTNELNADIETSQFNLSSDTSLASDSIGTQFIQQFATKIREQFTQKFADAEEVATDEIQQALFEVFGPEGLFGETGILKDSDDPGDEITPEDINIDFDDPNDSVIKFDFDLGGTTNITDLSLPSQIGLPQLGLKLLGENGEDTKAEVKLDYTFDFGFGIDTDTNEFFLDTSPKQDLSITLTPELPEATATLGFLQVKAKDMGSELKFSIDLDDGEKGDNRLTISTDEIDQTKDDELSNLRLTPDGSANINLNFDTSFDGSTKLPSISSDFNLFWSFTENGGVPDISFNNTQLDLGEFITNFTTPILKNIKDILSPIQPLINGLTTNIDFLTNEIPRGLNAAVVLDIEKEVTPGDVTLLDLLKAIDQFGRELPDPVSIPGLDDSLKFFKAVKNIDQLITLVSNSGGGKLPLEGFDLSSLDGNSEQNEK